MKKEFKIISDLIENNTRVLDVGCGDGTLMKYLKDKKNVDKIRCKEQNLENIHVNLQLNFFFWSNHKIFEYVKQCK